MSVIATDMSMEKDMVPDMGCTNLAMVVTDLAMARMELDMLDTVMVLPMATLHMGTIITIKNCHIIRKMQFVYLYFSGFNIYIYVCFHLWLLVLTVQNRSHVAIDMENRRGVVWAWLYICCITVISALKI